MSEDKKKPEGEGKKKPDDAKLAAAKAAGEKAKKEKAEKAAAAAAPKEVKVYKRTQPPRLTRLYRDEVVKKLQAEFGYTNPMQVPKLVKISINMGLGEAVANPKIIDTAVDELTAIAGQRPVVTKAKKSIATYKLRQGQKIGCMVTLRQVRMWEFLDRLVSVALPRVRDFKGISQKTFDGRGNFSLGIREQIIFPEINYDRIDKIKGMNITIVTTAKTDDEGRALLRHLGMPFRS
jgi:large subunit ribosomal protein L5